MISTAQVRMVSFGAGAATALLGLLLTTAASGQEWRGPGRVKGVVNNESGQPIAGAAVTLTWTDASESSTSKGPKTRLTDKKGRWSFIGLIDGIWTVAVEADGYIPFEDQTTIYAQGAETLRLEMKPIPQEQIEAERLQAVNETLQRGNELAEAGDHQGARGEYARALPELDAERQPDVLAAIANTYIQEGDLDSGVAELERALALDEGHAYSLRLMVAVLASQGRDDEAEQYLERLPDESSLDTNTKLNLGIMRYNEGELDEAREIFDEVIAAAPERADAYYYSGLVHLNQEKHALATERLRKYVELAPEGSHAAEARDFLEYLEGSQGASP